MVQASRHHKLQALTIFPYAYASKAGVTESEGCGLGYGLASCFAMCLQLAANASVMPNYVCCAGQHALDGWFNRLLPELSDPLFKQFAHVLV